MTPFPPPPAVDVPRFLRSESRKDIIMTKQDVTAAEIIRRLRSDPAYMAKNAEKERRRDVHIREVECALAPLLHSLKKADLS